MTDSDVRKYFQDNTIAYQQAAEAFRKKVLSWSWYRAIYFVAWAGLLIYFANQRQGTYLVLVLATGIVGFVWLIVKHNKLKLNRDIHEQLHLVNKEELDRLKYQFGYLPQGQQYKHPLHPYSKDLDIFGKHSLFQFTNRTATPGGSDRLASFYISPASREDIERRQQAVKELSKLSEWRNGFLANGRVYTQKPDSLPLFYNWLKEEKNLVDTKWAWMALTTLPALSAICIILASIGVISWQWLWLPVIANALVLSKTLPKSRAAYKATEPALGTLRTLALTAKLIEQKTWQSPLLLHLQQSLLNKESATASTQIGILRNILTGLESQQNAFYFALNFLFLQDLYWLLRAERWRKLHRNAIHQWFSAVFEWEALNSLAGTAFAQPAWAWPTITSGEAHFNAKKLGHPLLPAKRVSNNFTLSGNGQAILITGSNMAGKSTFLRTVGINVVLGLAGGPVCAEQLDLSPMQVFTSMRTEDNLEESVSSFYAELQRLQQLLAVIKADTNFSSDLPIPEAVQYNLPVLYFLDEILKGTNSEDRHKGAAALISQLQKLGATGLVSTHDLVLGQNAEKTGLQNYSFNSVVEGDQIHFNYKLEPGICTSFNATAFMKKMGIEV